MKPKPFEIIVEFIPQSTKTGITYEAHKKSSLIRCKDCKLNGLCVLSHTELAGEGYCAWAEPKEEKDDR